MTAHGRRVWVTVCWICAVTATALNGVIVGYGAVWLQFFGESADAEDYRVSAGGYGAAAVVLVWAIPAILTHRGPRWLAWAAGVSAAILGLLAANSVAVSTEAEPVSSPISTAWDGIGGVVWAPWTWALVALGIHGLYRLVHGAGIQRHVRVIPLRYHRGMAMTLRLTPEDEQLLAALADAEGVSRHEATLRAIREAAARHVHGAQVAELSARARERYADVLERLGR